MATTDIETATQWPALKTGNIDLIELLTLRGFDANVPSRIVRHQDNRCSMEDLLRNGWLEHYQSYQGDTAFRDARQIVSLYGLPGARAAFYGVYHVLGIRPAGQGPVLANCPLSQHWHSTANHYYDLERDHRFDLFRDRLIVDWGKATRSWVQRIDSRKPVIEILAPGRKLPAFNDYLEFSLSFAQVKDLFAHEDAHREWRARLSAVGGIYLILAETSGDLYVGSASGAEGFWGRWREYATTGHGGNTLLKALAQRDVNYPERFRFSILQILSKTMAREEIIEREGVYKNKLGSRAKGLNLN